MVNIDEFSRWLVHRRRYVVGDMRSETENPLTKFLQGQYPDATITAGPESITIDGRCVTPPYWVTVLWERTPAEQVTGEVVLHWVNRGLA